METHSSNINSHAVPPADTAGEEISIDEAKAWTAAYQEVHPEGLKSVFFSASVFQKLFEQTNATGIRIYNATRPDGQDCFILVGATEGNDLTDEGSRVFDKGRVCPDNCLDSPLNHN
jgi:hypothetical protein